MKTQNLSEEESITKMRDLVETIKIAMLLTGLREVPVSTNPMETRKTDKDGAIWFLSSVQSDHYENIVKNPEVQVLYSHPDEMLYLSAFGSMTVEKDNTILKELYTTADDKWFQGVNDTDLCALKFSPSDAFYWDKQKNKFIQFIRKGTEVLTDGENINETKGKLEF